MTDEDWKLLMEHRMTTVENAVLQWASDIATIKWAVGIGAASLIGVLGLLLMYLR